MDVAPLVQILTPLIIELVGEFKHRNDELTPDIVAARLRAKIDMGELKIDQAIAEIIRNQRLGGA